MRGVNVTAASENPYQSPPFVVDDASAAMRSADTDWKAVLRRWEILRVAYNVLVGATGLLTLMRFPSLSLDTIFLAVIYGLCANVMYLLGPATELYLRWFAEAWEGRLVPEWVVDFARSRGLTGLLFVGGTLFAVGLTLIVGLVEAAWAGQHGM